MKKRRTKCAVCGKRVGKGLVSFCQPHWAEWIQSPETKQRGPITSALAMSSLPESLRLRAQRSVLAAFDAAFIRRARRALKAEVKP